MRPTVSQFTLGTIWTCDANAEALRLDIFLGGLTPDNSRSRIQKWIEQGCFSINGEVARKKDFVKPGDRVELILAPEMEMTTLIPEDIPFPIIFEDEHIVVVDKPKGMITHPGNGVPSGTLANALAFRYKNLSDINGPLRPGILHRLDKDTSGLLVVAKNNAAHLNLSKQMEARDIHRIYHAIV